MEATLLQSPFTMILAIILIFILYGLESIFNVKAHCVSMLLSVIVCIIECRCIIKSDIYVIRVIPAIYITVLTICLGIAPKTTWRFGKMAVTAFIFSACCLMMFPSMYIDKGMEITTSIYTYIEAIASWSLWTICAIFISSVSYRLE